MTVGLALRANPQAPFKRTAASYHQNIAAGEKSELARKMPTPANLLNFRARQRDCTRPVCALP